MSILRPCPTALATALASGELLWSADLFVVTLADANVYYWTTWDSPLVYSGHTYACAAPWVRRTKWSVTNSMTIPTMDVTVIADNSAFAGGANLKLQAHNGLFDGATVTLSRAFMISPGVTSTLGAIQLFLGTVGKVQVIGNEVRLSVKGATNTLAQPAPRNTYLPTCLHTFCDAGCTLSAATFTKTGQIVGTSPAPSNTFITIPSGFTPPSQGLASYTGGFITMTSGVNNGQKRTIQTSPITGWNLSYPLPATPVGGTDTFSIQQGCAKTTKACTSYSNIINFRGFPFVPTPEQTDEGQFPSSSG